MSELKTSPPEPIQVKHEDKKVEYIPIYVNKTDKKPRKPKTQKQIEAFQAKCQTVRVAKVNEKKKEKEELEMQMFQKFKEYINSEKKTIKPKKEQKKKEKPTPPSPDDSDDEEPIIERVGQMDRPETANKVQEILNNFRGSLTNALQKTNKPEYKEEFKSSMDKIVEEPEYEYIAPPKFQPKFQRSQQFIQDTNPNINIFR